MKQPARCTHCNSETELFVGDVPICLRCDEVREKKNLTRHRINFSIEADNGETTRLAARAAAFSSVARAS